MNRELQIILVKFTLICIGMIVYILVMMFYVSPMLIEQAYGQSAFDVPNQFNQPFDQQFQQQYQQPYQQQFQQPYMDPYSQQYQQPYGMQQPYYGQQQYGYPQPQNPIQFGTSEVIYTLLGGGAIGYARYNQSKRNQDKELTRELYAELLREKQEKRELARVQYQHMPNQGNDIKDAPSIQLQKLDQDIDSFSDKVAKA